MLYQANGRRCVIYYNSTGFFEVYVFVGRIVVQQRNYLSAHSAKRFAKERCGI